MNRTAKGVLLLIAALVPTWAGLAMAMQPAAVIVSPKKNDQVAYEQELIGKVGGPGIPIVFVRADLPGTLWWVQKPVQPTGKGGHFKANIRIGNGKTTVGTPFKVVVLMAPMDVAKKLKPGDALKELPDLPRSAETAISYRKVKPKAPAGPLVDVSLALEAKASVPRVQNVAGKVPAGRHPVVVVRSAEFNSHWWVQGKASVDGEGNFSALARFGGDKTKVGDEFRLVTLLFKDADAANKLKPGLAFPELPADVDRSGELVLFRAEPKKTKSPAKEGAE